MLILARHGQSEANAAGMLVGRADSPLTDLGRRQADAIGAALAKQAQVTGRSIGRLISSPLGRAEETAARIAAAYSAGDGLRVEVEVEERLTELDYGELDLVQVGSVGAATWKAWRSDSGFRPPGGETLDELASRINSLLEDLLPLAAGRDGHEDVVLISHVSPIKAAIARALDVGIGISWRMSLSVASISRIGPGPGGEPVLVSFNETGHLAGL